ncbi:MAG: PAS domain S-box protein [Candidatus Margulisbacteria bacterium]|nr:PAS domain S-box protein [Candidatus Margulisiibacteriota bacterium]MBU1617004.1 PAS domain S-box protein [Candidatus Margulisiibacteriota bacterium]
MKPAEIFEVAGFQITPPGKEKTFSDILIEIAPNIIVGLGEESKIIIFNKYAEKLTGYLAEEVIGKKWLDIFLAPETRPAITALFNEIVDKNIIEHHYENPIIMKDGTPRLIAWNNTVLLDKGKFKMVLSVGMDVTEQRMSENELRNKIQEMEKFQKILMGREDRIIELKSQIKELKGRLGEK